MTTEKRKLFPFTNSRLANASPFCTPCSPHMTEASSDWCFESTWSTGFQGTIYSPLSFVLVQWHNTRWVHVKIEKRKSFCPCLLFQEGPFLRLQSQFFFHIKIQISVEHTVPHGGLQSSMEWSRLFCQSSLSQMLEIFQISCPYTVNMRLFSVWDQLDTFLFWS